MKGSELISIGCIIGTILLIMFFFVMTINTIKYYDIYRNFKFVSTEKRVHINRELSAYRILMCFILLGCLFLLVGIVLKKTIIGSILIGLILLLTSIIVFMGIGIQAKMLEIINETYLQTIKALISAIECRDTYTKGHSEHVANLCVLISSKLAKECLNEKMIEVAAYLHDIGKIGIPEAILNKVEKLDEEEFNIMKTHPKMGKSIIENISGFDEILDWIFYHHERIDGKGYYNVKGKDIPLEARIIAIADTFSALATDRPYRKGMKYEEAIEIMKNSAGSQLDGEILEIFLTIPINELEKCMPSSLC